MQNQTRNYFRRSTLSSKWALVAIIGVMCLLAGGVYLTNSKRQLREFCDQAVLDHRDAIRRHEMLKEQQRRLQVQAAADTSAEHERLQWTRAIAKASAEIQASLTHTREQRPFVLNVRQVSDEVTKNDTEFWSFRPLKRSGPPNIGDSDWPRNPIDHFILSKLQQAGLTPNREASRLVLARRLWFDLLGLPPSVDDVEAFAASNSPSDYEQLSERLLAHPGFGERWARFWLDLARYADSNGYEEDELRPQAYPYRDFVIWAMNADLPFNVFVRWQIAGDELEPQNPLAVAATGFFTAPPYNTFIPQESERYDELDDMVSTLSSAMLGLSVGCARCHDHRYDPIPMRDFYGLVAIFAETKRHHSYLVPDGGREYRRWFDPVDSRRKEIHEMLKARIKEDNISGLDYFTAEEKNLLRQPIDPDNKKQERLISLCERCLFIQDYQVNDSLKPLPADRKRYDQLMAEIAELELLLPVRPPVGLTLTGSAVSITHVLEGGDPKRKREEVGPGFLTAVTRGRPLWDDATWKSWAATPSADEPPLPRSALANWITDVNNGPGNLLARVIANRLWQQHFGQGLVRTPSDFGSQGDLPSHPDLLDWLANELIDHDWSLKHIHRLIVNSATYRQATTLSPDKLRLDPDNRLVGRRRPKRLTAEMIWDTMLQVSGNLKSDMYGPGVKIPISQEVVFHTQKKSEETWPSNVDTDRPALWRRGVYVMLKRTIPVPLMQMFDAPAATFSCNTRKVTTVPTQALALWHAPFVRRQSVRLAQRVTATSQPSSFQVPRRGEKPGFSEKSELLNATLVHRLFLLTVSRNPSPAETEKALAFLDRNGGARNSTIRTQNLVDLCQVMFLTNEFIYVD